MIMGLKTWQLQECDEHEVVATPTHLPAVTAKLVTDYRPDLPLDNYHPLGEEGDVGMADNEVADLPQVREGLVLI